MNSEPSTVWLVAISSVGMLHDAIPVGALGLSESDAQKWANERELQGLQTERVDDVRYLYLLRQSKDLSLERERDLPRYIGTNCPVEVPLAELRRTADGLRAIVRLGESDLDGVRWCEPEFVVLRFDTNCNGQSEAGLLVATLGGQVSGVGFAGYASSTKAWWRYASEAVTGSGQYCLQVLALL